MRYPITRPLAGLWSISYRYGLRDFGLGLYFHLNDIKHGDNCWLTFNLLLPFIFVQLHRRRMQGRGPAPPT